MACNGHWCHGCYNLEDDGTFPIRRPTDEQDYMVILEKDRTRFLFGRAGDHLMTQFQCDECHFQNLKGRNSQDSTSDALLLKYIRRANLDACWARESGTVNNTRREIAGIRTRAASLGIGEILPKMGPLPVEDIQGMGLACCMLMRSLDEGRNESTIQYTTVLKMKTAFANMYRVSVHSSERSVIAKDLTKLYTSTSPTHSEWFERFQKGLHERMGDKVKQDLGISIELLKKLMARYENRWVAAGANRRAQQITLFPAVFCIVAFCCALRGEEVPMMSLGGIAEHLEAAVNHNTPHVVIALVGRFKNETSEQNHLMPIVFQTDSGLEPGKWIVRMVQWYAEIGINTGWVFRKGEIRQGAQSVKGRQSDVEYDILSEIVNIQKESNGIVGVNVDVFDEYGLSRSFRRGSDTHAINCMVDTADIERNNRWRSVESSKAKQPKLRMIHHYTEVSLLLPSLLRYSKAL